MAAGGTLVTMVVRLMTDSKQLEAGVASAATRIGALQTKMLALGKKLTKGLTLPILAVGAGSVAAFSSFDDAMTSSLAIMGDVSDTMRNDMAQAAREVGKSTTFSATEAAKAYFYLASAGLDAAQSIGAMPLVAKFAQAGNFDLALATDLLTDAQSALGLTVDDTAQNIENMTRVSDVLVKANTLANASVEQFSESLTTRAGAALRLLNKDMEEGVAVLAVFADQGVKGAEAGTRLDIVLRDLQRASITNREEWDRLGVSVYDATGTMLPLADIVQQMEGLLGNMSDEQKRATLMQMGFTDRSVAATTALLGTSEQIRRYEAGLRSAGGLTEEVAQKQLKSFRSQMILAKDKLVDAGIAIGQVLAPKIQALVTWISKAASWFANLSPKIQNTVIAIAGIAAAIGPVLVIGSKLISTVRKISSAISVVGALAPKVVGWFSSIGNSISMAAGKGARAAGDFRSLGKLTSDMGANAGTATGSSLSLAGGLGILGGAAITCGVAVWKLYDNQRKWEAECKKNLIESRSLATELEGLKEATANCTLGSDEWSQAMDRQAEAAQALIDKTEAIATQTDAAGRAIDINTSALKMLAGAYSEASQSAKLLTAEKAEEPETLGRSIALNQQATATIIEQQAAYVKLQDELARKKAKGEEVTIAEMKQLDTLGAKIRESQQDQSLSYEKMTESVKAYGDRLKTEGLAVSTSADIGSMLTLLSDARPEVKKLGLDMLQQIVDAEAEKNPAIKANMQSIMDNVRTRIEQLPAGDRTAAKMREILTEEINAHGPITGEMATILNDMSGIISGADLSWAARAMMGTLGGGISNAAGRVYETARSVVRNLQDIFSGAPRSPGGGHPTRHGGSQIHTTGDYFLSAGEGVVSEAGMRRLSDQDFARINRGLLPKTDITQTIDTVQIVLPNVRTRRDADEINRELMMVGRRSNHLRRVMPCS